MTGHVASEITDPSLDHDVRHEIIFLDYAALCKYDCSSFATGKTLHIEIIFECSLATFEHRIEDKFEKNTIRALSEKHILFE